MDHGHAKSDARNLWLHRAALRNLAAHPTLRQRCLASLERWLTNPAFRSSRPHLEEWKEMLLYWSDAAISAVILDDEKGQTLRQCSPLAPTLTVAERWHLLAELRRDA